MKSALYELVKNPHSGWSVKEINRDGIIASFDEYADAERFLRGIAQTEPRDSPVVLEIEGGSAIAPSADD